MRYRGSINMPIGGVLLVSDRTRRSGNGKLQNYTEYWPSNLDHGRNATKPARWNGLPDGVKVVSSSQRTPRFNLPRRKPKSKNDLRQTDPIPPVWLVAVQDS